MDAFITHQRITGLNVHRKPIIAAIIVTMIMGFFAGCEEAYTPALKEPIIATAPTSGEIAALSDEIKQLVKELEYSDKVSEDFAEMVIGWKDKQGRPVLVVWKQKLAEAKKDLKQGKISTDQLALTEASVIRELAQTIKMEVGFEWSGDKVAPDFVNMLKDWKDAQGRSVFLFWNQRINQARYDCHFYQG